MYAIDLWHKQYCVETLQGSRASLETVQTYYNIAGSVHLAFVASVVESGNGVNIIREEIVKKR